MDKGIFYLLCSVVILVAIAGVGFAVNNKIGAVCGVRTITVEKTVMAKPTITVVPTATTSALIKKVVVTPTKAVK